MNGNMARVLRFIALTGPILAATAYAHAGDDSSTRVYENRLKPIVDPRPLLADHPRFVEPVCEVARFEAPTLIDDPGRP